MKEGLIVDESIDGQIVYEALIGRFPGLPSRKSLKKAISKGEIFIEGRVAKWDDALELGQRVSHISQVVSKEEITLDQPLDILYQDEFMAIINKPPGILVNGTHARTIEKALPAYFEVLDGYLPRPAHRLDKATSGCLVVARTAKAAQELGRSFEERKVDKSYLAIVMGKVAIEGKINLRIDGKEAATSWKRIDHVTSEKAGHLSLLKVNIATGRRHQIRKHLASIEHPLLGDKEYGDHSGQFGQGLYLHAWQLMLPHPLSGSSVHVEAPIPKKFGRIFADLKSIE